MDSCRHCLRSDVADHQGPDFIILKPPRRILVVCSIDFQSALSPLPSYELLMLSDNYAWCTIFYCLTFADLGDVSIISSGTILESKKN